MRKWTGRGYLAQETNGESPRPGASHGPPPPACRRPLQLGQPRHLRRPEQLPTRAEVPRSTPAGHLWQPRRSRPPLCPVAAALKLAGPSITEHLLGQSATSRTAAPRTQDPTLVNSRGLVDTIICGSEAKPFHSPSTPSSARVASLASSKTLPSPAQWHWLLAPACPILLHVPRAETQTRPRFVRVALIDFQPARPFPQRPPVVGNTARHVWHDEGDAQP